MPFGQREATRLLWKLKPAMVETAERSALRTVDDVASFTPLLDWGAMEHPALATRLFIS
jgi:urease accessory protein UreF